jgi:hypothetical protein
MQALLHARVDRVQSLKHRLKPKTSCIFSLTMRCLQGSLQGTLSKNGSLLAHGGNPTLMVPSTSWAGSSY